MIDQRAGGSAYPQRFAFVPIRNDFDAGRQVRLFRLKHHLNDCVTKRGGLSDVDANGPARQLVRTAHSFSIVLAQLFDPLLGIKSKKLAKSRQKENSIADRGSWSSTRFMIEEPERQKEFERAYYIRVRRLPSLETQVVECFRILQEFGAQFGAPYTWNNIDLRRGPFRLNARSGFWIYNQQPLFGFAIGAVGIAPRFQNRGWFRNFSEIVYQTMPHNLFVVENVDHDGLNQSLRLNPDYHRFKVNCFARSELFSDAFDARLLRPGNYRKFKELGGEIKPRRFSVSTKKQLSSGDPNWATRPMDWYGDCPPDAAPSPILQMMMAPDTIPSAQLENFTNHRCDKPQ